MIVSDSTPLIHLAKIERLDLLNKLFRIVVIPVSVFDEVVLKGEEHGYLDAKMIKAANWIKMKNLNKEEQEELSNILKTEPIGKTEGEAIILAKNMKSPLLIDDSDGQKVARLFDIETYWTTSVIIKAFTERIITKAEAKNIIEQLVESRLRIRPEVVVALMKLLE